MLPNDPSKAKQTITDEMAKRTELCWDTVALSIKDSPSGLYA